MRRALAAAAALRPSPRPSLRPKHRPALYASLGALLCAAAVAACGTVMLPQSPRPTFRPDALPPTARMLWIETASLFDSLGTPERLHAGLARIARAGFTDVVVEVKPFSGGVAYPSRVATRLTTVGGHTPEPSWDAPADAIAAGRALGLRVHLAANVFAEGDHARRVGPLYGTRRAWQTTVLAPDGTVRGTTRLRPDERTTDIAYLNPVRPDVRNHQLAVVAEIVGRYQPDGLLLDRVRFESAAADVSPESREAFERWRRTPVAAWPADVFTRAAAAPAAGVVPSVVPGPLYPQWTEWRALVVRSFVEAARQTVRGTHPATRFGLVAPADYAAAAEVGVNWGAVGYDPSADYPWATPMYREKGLAAFVDLLVPDLPIAHAYADTVLLGAALRRTAGATRVVPGLHVRAFPDAAAFEAALRTTLATTGGVLVSSYGDLARQPAFWAALERAFPPLPAAAVPSAR